MKNKLIIALLAIGMSTVILVVEWLERYYFLGDFDQKFYTLIIAILFTALGAWVSMKLFRKPTKPVEIEEKNSDNGAGPEIATNLNKREYEVLALLDQGLSNQEMADQLFLALPTIKTHLSKLYAKLEVKSRTQAIRKARELKLL